MRSEKVDDCGCMLTRDDNGLHMVNCPLHDAAPRLLKALEALFRECSMIHKHWGEDCNQKQSDAAIAEAITAVKQAKGAK